MESPPYLKMATGSHAAVTSVIITINSLLLYTYWEGDNHFRAKKVEAPSKSQDFHGDPHEMAQVVAFPATK